MEQPAGADPGHMEHPPLATWRVDYAASGLDPAAAPEAPLPLFLAWLADARAGNVAEPNAMALATADGRGAPSARMVLLKAADPRGFSFFTNYGSRKGQELLGNPACALTFPWQGIGRQVCVRGRAEKLTSAESAEYFALRPRGAQVGAWASQQSQEVTREVLAERWRALSEHWADDEEIPRPDNWGGFMVVAHAVEFWVGQPSRLHDRVEYRRVAPGGLDDPGAWQRRRLSP